MKNIFIGLVFIMGYVISTGAMAEGEAVTQINSSNNENSMAINTGKDGTAAIGSNSNSGQGKVTQVNSSTNENSMAINTGKGGTAAIGSNINK